MEIIICEDNSHQRKDLENLINTEIENLDFKIALSTSNPNAVIKHVENNNSNMGQDNITISNQQKINPINNNQKNLKRNKSSLQKSI